MLKPGKNNPKLRAILLGSLNKRRDLTSAVKRLRPIVESVFEISDEDFGGKNPVATVGADLAVVFGGDGSILRAVRQMGGNQIPVLGVNLGKLGFLADTQPEALATNLQLVREGRFKLVDHLMLDCEVRNGERVVASTMGLNEVAIIGGPPYNILEIDLYVSGALAASYSCDGLIISTPVGSTAHNLSTGGPIVRKDVAAVVIAPISPHTLTVRPVVDSADQVFELQVSQPNRSTSVVVDGQTVAAVEPETRIRVQRSKNVFQLIEVEGHNYYRTLREKLGWGIGFADHRQQEDGRRSR